MHHVTLAPHDPTWASRFDAERALLARAFTAESVRIDHVGSTAVPGLVAKPLIDILVGVSSLAIAETAAGPLRDLRYEYVPDYEASLPHRRYFRKPFGRPRSHHLHCFVLGSPEWEEMLRFRDILRNDANVREEYAALKRDLAAAESKQDYTRKKGSFVRGVLGGSAS